MFSLSLHLLLLTRLVYAVCPDSDGLAGYRFSHAGFWRYTPTETRNIGGITECKRLCDNDASCIAFAHQESRDVCKTYSDVGDLKTLTGYSGYFHCTRSVSIEWLETKQFTENECVQPSGTYDLPKRGSYTIEAQVQISADTLHAGGILGYGRYGTQGQTNALRFNQNGNSINGLVNYWWARDVSAVNLEKPLNDGSWHHVAATYDGVQRKLWIDGIVVKEQIENTKFDIDSQDNFCIGQTNTNEHFRGWLQNVRVYKYDKEFSYLAGLDTNKVDELLLEEDEEAQQNIAANIAEEDEKQLNTSLIITVGAVFVLASLCGFAAYHKFVVQYNKRMAKQPGSYNAKQIQQPQRVPEVPKKPTLPPRPTQQTSQARPQKPRRVPQLTNQKPKPFPRSKPTKSTAPFQKRSPPYQKPKANSPPKRPWNWRSTSKKPNRPPVRRLEDLP